MYTAKLWRGSPIALTLSELEVAKKVLGLARQAQKRTYADPRIAMRESHIGYYLVGEGVAILSQSIGYHPTFGERFRTFLRKHPDEFLLGGIAVLTLAIITIAVWLLTPVTTPVALVLLSMLILLLPGSQAAVQLMNYATTNLLPATTLPKLDFSKGIPDDCVTMVAIPTSAAERRTGPHAHRRAGSALPRQPRSQYSLCNRLRSAGCASACAGRQCAGGVVFEADHRIERTIFRKERWVVLSFSSSPGL